jgi:hypothetical protein
MGVGFKKVETHPPNGPEHVLISFPKGNENRQAIACSYQKKIFKMG